MDETVETVLIGIHPDVATFKRDADALKTALEGALGQGVERAGRLIETRLVQAVRTGKLSFDDLKATALAALDQIAAKAVSAGIDSLFPKDGGGGGGGLSGMLTSGATRLLGALGLAGRATGGPVSPGRPYLVGEQGPELFVPASAGSVAASSAVPVVPRDVRVAIHIAAPSGSEPQALARSGRQVARAVTRALAQAER